MGVTIGNALIKGDIYFKFPRKWKKKYCVLDKSTKVSDHIRLFLLQNEAEYTNILSTSKDLTNFYYAEVYGCFAGLHLDSRSFVMMLMCTDSVECIAFKDFLQMDNWKTVITENLKEKSMHATLVQKVKRRRESLNQPGLLHIQQHRVCFISWPTETTPPKLILSFLLTNIQYYGIVDHDSPDGIPRYCITASKSSVTGEGERVYMFECSEPMKLDGIIKDVINDHVFEKEVLYRSDISLSSSMSSCSQSYGDYSISSRAFTNTSTSGYSSNYSHISPVRSVSCRNPATNSRHQRTRSFHNYLRPSNEPQRRPSYPNQFGFDAEDEVDENLDCRKPTAYIPEANKTDFYQWPSHSDFDASSSPIQNNLITHSPAIPIKKNSHGLNSITNLVDQYEYPCSFTYPPRSPTSSSNSPCASQSLARSQSPNNDISLHGNFSDNELSPPRYFSKSAGYTYERANFFSTNENPAFLKRMQSFNDGYTNRLSTVHNKHLPDKKENLQKLVESSVNSSSSADTHLNQLDKHTANSLCDKRSSDDLIVDTDCSIEDILTDSDTTEPALPPPMISFSRPLLSNTGEHGQTSDHKNRHNAFPPNKFLVSAITNKAFTLDSPNPRRDVSCSTSCNLSNQPCNFSSGEDGTLSQSDSSSSDSPIFPEERSDNFNSSSTARLIPSSTSSQVSSSHNSSTGTNMLGYDSPDGVAVSMCQNSKPTLPNLYTQLPVPPRSPNFDPNNTLSTIQERKPQLRQHHKDGRERSISMCSSKQSNYFSEDLSSKDFLSDELYNREVELGRATKSESLVSLPWNLFNKSDDSSPADQSRSPTATHGDFRSLNRQGSQEHRSRTLSSDSCENIYEEIYDPSQNKIRSNKDIVFTDTINFDGNISPPSSNPKPLSQNNCNSDVVGESTFTRQNSNGSGSTFQQKSRPRYASDYIDTKTLRRNRSESSSIVNIGQSSSPENRNVSPEYVSLTTYPYATAHVYANISDVRIAHYENLDAIGMNFDSGQYHSHNQYHIEDNRFPDHQYDNLPPVDIHENHSPHFQSTIPAQNGFLYHQIDASKPHINYAILQLGNPSLPSNLPFVPISSGYTNETSATTSSTSISSSQQSQNINSPKLNQHHSDYIKIDFRQTEALSQVQKVVESNQLSDNRDETVSVISNVSKKSIRKAFLSSSSKKS